MRNSVSFDDNLRHQAQVMLRRRVGNSLKSLSAIIQVDMSTGQSCLLTRRELTGGCPRWRGLTYLPDLPPHLLHTSTPNSICATYISQFKQSRFLKQWPTRIHCIPWVKHSALGVQFKHARYNQSGILYAHVWLPLVIGYPVLNGLYTKLACNCMLFHVLLANYWQTNSPLLFHTLLAAHHYHYLHVISCVALQALVAYTLLVANYYHELQLVSLVGMLSLVACSFMCCTSSRPAFSTSSLVTQSLTAGKHHQE